MKMNGTESQNVEVAQPIYTRTTDSGFSAFCLGFLFVCVFAVCWLAAIIEALEKSE